MSRGPNDRGRGASGPRTAVRTEADGEPTAASSAEHRRKLEALFSGGATNTSAPRGAGPTRSERVFASPRKSVGRGPSEYRLRLERLRMAREPDEIQRAADAFLAHHQLPDDADILFKVLQHPAEKVVRESLGQISALLMQNRFGGTLFLKDHLAQLAQRVSEDATHSYIDGIRAQLAQRDTDD